jgi:hypothetical protein
MNFECYSYMSYIYMRKHHKEESSVWESNFRKSSFKGSIHKDKEFRRSSRDEKLPLPLISKGERFIRFLEREHRGMFPGEEISIEGP